MTSSLRILHLEDDPDDVAFIESLLRKGGLDFEIERVYTRVDFLQALEQGPYDLILSDFSLPSFDGMSGLSLAVEKAPDVPFLFISGTLGEERAIEALQHGARDYILKQRLGRLVPAVRRALAEAADRQALRRAEEAMVQSEHKYRQLFECLGEAALLADAASGRVLDTNRQAEILFARPRNEIVGANVKIFLSPATLAQFQRTTQQEAARVVFEGEVVSAQGQAVPVAITASPIVLYGRRLVLGLYRDITEMIRARAEIDELARELHREEEASAHGSPP